MKLRHLLALSLVAAVAGGCAAKSTRTAAGGSQAPAASQAGPSKDATAGNDRASLDMHSNMASIQFRPVFFDYDSATLRDDARQALDENARLLRANPGLTTTIEGHCDERGTTEYNLALGERRAERARAYLTKAGVSPDRIGVVSFGKERPFASGSTESAWSQNRRAQFAVDSSRRP